MNKKVSRYKAHLFICNQTRDDGRKSCGNNANPKLKSILKDEITKRGWKPMIRISESSCLGVCDAGPNIMIYPQKIWLSEVSREDVPEIIQTLEKIIAE